jgi:hypothetical protein
MITVKELIIKLQAMSDQDATVFIHSESGYDSFINDVKEFEADDIKAVVITWSGSTKEGGHEKSYPPR